MARLSLLMPLLALVSGCFLVGPTAADVAAVRQLAGCPSAEVTQIESAKPMYRATGCGKTVDTFCDSTATTSTCLPLSMTVEEYAKWAADRSMKHRKCKDYTFQRGWRPEGIVTSYEAAGCGVTEHYRCQNDTGFPRCTMSSYNDAPPASAKPEGSRTPAAKPPKGDPAKK